MLNAECYCNIKDLEKTRWNRWRSGAWQCQDDAETQEAFGNGIASLLVPNQSENQKKPSRIMVSM